MSGYSRSDLPPQEANGFRKPPTLRDVAERVGVTLGTASAVLNGSKSGTRVSPSTRERLVQAAAELGYRPNEVARSLARRRSKLIGFCSIFEFVSPQNAFLSELLGGVQEATSDRNEDLVLRNIPMGASPQRVVDSLADRRVDGLVILAPANPELYSLLQTAHLPVVALVDAYPGVASVVVDDYRGGELMADHLFERGHRHVIYRGWRYGPLSAKRRESGFRTRARSLGMHVSDGRVLDTTYETALLPAEIDLIEGRSPATAIAVWGDDLAALTCESVTDRGYRIPSDLAIIGFNGVPTRVPQRWDLTTIVAPWREVGRQSVDLVNQLMTGEAPTTIQLPVSFRQGATT